MPSTAIVPALLVALTAAGAARAQVEVQGAWSRPEAVGLRTAVAYLTLVNRGRDDDRLTDASSPKAAMVSLHRSAMAGGVITMEPVTGGLDLPPGRPVALAPDGLHLMLEGLKGGLRAGEHYPLTLRFKHSPPRTIDVAVRGGPGGMAMPMR